MRPTELTTARCLLRPIAPADRDHLHELWTSPGGRRFLWDDTIIPLSRTVDAIEHSGHLFRANGFGLWGAWLTDAVTMAGFAGLWPFRDPPEIELVYGVAEPLWNHGYATEIARAMVAYGFETLNMPAVRASTDTGHAASIRVLQKLGFTFVDRRIVGGLDTVFFELPRLAAVADQR
jgi:[ribosomal protein S5]-alanine N-acetyltransferase